MLLTTGTKIPHTVLFHKQWLHRTKNWICIHICMMPSKSKYFVPCLLCIDQQQLSVDSFVYMRISFLIFSSMHACAEFLLYLLFPRPGVETTVKNCEIIVHMPLLTPGNRYTK